MDRWFRKVPVKDIVFVGYPGVSQDESSAGVGRSGYKIWGSASSVRGESEYSFAFNIQASAKEKAL